MNAVPEPNELPPLPPRSPEMRLFTPDMWDYETPESFVPLAGATGILIREIDTARRFTDGRALARVYRADPATERRYAPAITAVGPKLCLVLSGEGVFELEGQGELILKESDSWVAPTGSAQTLLDASADFSLLEYEFPMLAATTSGTELTDEMLMRFGPDSYVPTPGFNATLQRDLDALKELTQGGAHATALRGNPPHVWAGSPWHLHMQEIQLAYHLKGEMSFDFEGVGRIDVKPGTFWFQTPFGRHREVTVSLDFEGINVDIPAVAPTTVFVYDEELGEYTATTYGSTTDLSEQAGAAMNESN
ncbi:hypothetical protein ACIA49_32785 [Kribbella sp. NPDC051587]|uniref:hypothetical protein n=1 Tax=Kribbella sp. NPDC051587 TaxID=3364119 RepID=UPI0037AF04D7